MSENNRWDITGLSREQWVSVLCAIGDAITLCEDGVSSAAKLPNSKHREYWQKRMDRYQELYDFVRDA